MLPTGLPASETERFSGAQLLARLTGRCGRASAALGDRTEVCGVAAASVGAGAFVTDKGTGPGSQPPPISCDLQRKGRGRPLLAALPCVRGDKRGRKGGAGVSGSPHRSSSAATGPCFLADLVALRYLKTVSAVCPESQLFLAEESGDTIQSGSPRGACDDASFVIRRFQHLRPAPPPPPPPASPKPLTPGPSFPTHQPWSSLSPPLTTPCLVEPGHFYVVFRGNGGVAVGR